VLAVGWTYSCPLPTEARLQEAQASFLDSGNLRPAGLAARARPKARPVSAANLRSDRGTRQDDRAEQRLIGLGRNCQPKQADTPRSQF
jgi:hypothetical protein